MISILEEAAEVRKDRAARVDDPAGNFARIAAIWEVVFGHPVTTKQVALAMIGLKLARECYRPWRDNLVDLAGYADCAAEIEGYDGNTDGPVCGDGPQVKTGSDEGGSVSFSRKDCGQPRNGNRTTSAGHTYPVYHAKGTPDSGP